MPTSPLLDKPSLEEYPDWLRNNHDIDLEGGAERSRYDFAIPSLKVQFEESRFWTALPESLVRWDQEFRAEHNDYRLLESAKPSDIETKPYNSVVEKSFRWNVVNNRRWPAPPIESETTPGKYGPLLRMEDAGEWYGPANWYHHFTDIVRTRLTANFMDGVVFLADKIEALASTVGVNTSRRSIARPDGYHAVHVLISQQFNMIDSRSGEPTSVETYVEVQITTRIQETIGGMLHNVYEGWRRLEAPPDGWEWDHSSREFAVNYLGPTLHYIEGMIVMARERIVD